MKVLVAYSSKYGATKGIAERIGSAMRRPGLDVVVARCKDVRDPSGYDAFVVGSAAYMFNWRKDARKFVRRNAELLAERPVWLFSSGPLGTDTVDKDGNDVLAGAEPKQFAEFDDLVGPRGMQVFFGAFDPEQVRGVDRIVAWMPAIHDVMPSGDFRDWKAIDDWAHRIADELAVPASPAAPDASA